MNTPVSFEIAKLAKDKGFSELTEWFYYPTAYNKNGMPRLIADGSNDDINSTYYDGDSEGMTLNLDNHNFNKDFYSAPTIAEVIMWLYEKYGIWIWVERYSTLFRPYAEEIGNERFSKWEGYKYKSPTEAYEAAIEYTLNNLI